MQEIVNNTQKNLVSVIVPVYNVEPYLKDCLSSILRQTWQNIDVILIDDGSPDACGQICDYYAEIDSRVRVFHTENKGLSAARNLGIEKAKETDSEFLVFVDSDDWLEDNMIEVLTLEALRSGADILTCGEYNEYTDRRVIRSYNHSYCSGIEAAKSILMNKLNMHVMNKIWKKECFKTILFPEGRVFEDLAIIYKVFMNSTLTGTIKDVLYHYRRRSAGIFYSKNLKNRFDFWLSTLDQKEAFLNCPSYNSDNKIIDLCEKRCVQAAIRLWGAYYKSSKVEQKRYQAKIKDVAVYIHDNIPCFGYKRWPIQLRVGALISHLATMPSFAFAYYLTWFGTIINKKRGQLY